MRQIRMQNGVLLALALTAPLIAPLAGCADRPRTAQQATLSACRQRADEVYMKQNRYLLSERDTRDSPFSSTGLEGITTNGLSGRYARDEMVQDCVAGTTPSGGATGITEIGTTAPAQPH